MIKKFYYSLVSMKYVYFMFGIPLLIFTVAFIETRKKLEVFRYIMMFLAVLLGIVLFFYYRDKMKISKQLKNVDDINKYERGGVVDRSWVLEDRVLCCKDLTVCEVISKDVDEVSVEMDTRGKTILHLHVKDQLVDMSALSKEEAERFVAYLKRKNPNVILNGVEPKGNGTLKELGAGIQV